MRSRWLTVMFAVLLVPAASPFVDATGGSQTFRIVTTGDAYMISLSSSCPGTYAGPVVDPSNPNLLDMVLDAIPGTCWVLKTNLGYDGLTGASTAATVDHVNHAFECAVTSSATGVVGNLLPFPANMAISDSFAVGFDLNGDNSADTAYGGRVYRPPLGAVLNRVNGAVATQDVATLADTPNWYANNFALNGATGVVSGNVDGPTLIIWNEGGSDVTIDCTF